jgi:hypothetical protein
MIIIIISKAHHPSIHLSHHAWFHPLILLIHIWWTSQNCFALSMSCSCLEDAVFNLISGQILIHGVNPTGCGLSNREHVLYPYDQEKETAMNCRCLIVG